jgi:PAS domain S-box-containing protein
MSGIYLPVHGLAFSIASANSVACTGMNNYARLSKAELLRRLRALEGEAAQRTAPAYSSIESALQESEARMRAILQTAVDAIITIDEHGIIESLNPEAEEMFGYKAAELIGKNVKVLMPSPYREEHDGYIANYCRTGRAKIIGIGREVVAQRKDGSTFPIDLAVSEVRFGDKRVLGRTHPKRTIWVQPTPTRSPLSSSASTPWRRKAPNRYS